LSKITTHKLDKLSELLWNNYVTKKNASQYHYADWRHLIKEVFGHESYYIYALDENQDIVGILPLVRLKSLLFGDYLVSLPYFNYGGCVADNQKALDSLLVESDVLRKNLGCSHVELRSCLPIESELPCREDKVTMLLDLPDDADILWKNIGTKRRAQVKRPIREGVKFEFGGVELLDDFYHVFSINMRDLGTPVYSKSFFKAIFKWFPKKAHISIVRLDGEAVGTGFLLGNGQLVEIPWASTLRKVNKIGVNMFLYWNILRSSIEQGYTVFDFGRSSKDAGTLRFKKQWGAEQKQLYWYYQLASEGAIPQINHSNPKYRLLINVWKKLPVSVCNLIGPKIVKSIS
jgi:serine/alanine adding enzyme